MILVAMVPDWSDTASAQTPPGDVIKDRIAHFREMGTAFKAIGDELKSPSPNLPSLQQPTTLIDSLSGQIPAWFPAGSGPAQESAKGIIATVLGWFSADARGVSAEEQTKAKPAIWTEWDAFKQAQQRFHLEARKMLEVVEGGGNSAAITSQFKVLGSTCKSCHDRFREKGKDDQ